MGVYTTYDEKRDELRDKLTECLRMAKELFDEDIWGYDEMREDYDIDVYQAIKKARDTV
jgi:5-methylthioribose kinase